MSSPAPVEKGPQWTNSYEAQLSDAELHWLHTALLTRNPSDKAIRAKLPPWRDGPRKGQPVSAATLSNIRDRLELEEDFQANGQTVESMLEAERAANPNITQEELDRQGLKLFTLLSIRKRDTKSFVSLQRSQKDRETLRLEREKFEFDAAAAALAKLPELLALTRDTSLSDDDRLEQARLKLFGSTPA